MSLPGLLGAGALLLLAILACIGISRAKGGKAHAPLPARPPAPRYPDPTPAAPAYRAYTTEFDVECSGKELGRVLAWKALNRSSSRNPVPLDPAERRGQFDAAYAEAAADLTRPESDLSDTVVLLLLDQSGSMAERMPRVAGALLAALKSLEAAGASTLLAGFTTVGWKGGRARQKWLKAGRPRNPGRLCDLLHVVYSAPEEATTRAHLLPLAGRAICFENVDGEAILWAEQQLLALPHSRRCLVVISDGAPVDDSTLTENSAGFLWNHLVDTVADLGARGQIALGGVGIDHDVARPYLVTRQVSGDGGLAVAINAIVAELRD